MLAYPIVKRAALAHDFKYRDQLRDAARSAPRNIAEGFARYKHKEFAQFVRIANGSLGEVLDHFIDAVDSGYLSAEELPRHEHACKKALKATNGLSVISNQHPIRRESQKSRRHLTHHSTLAPNPMHPMHPYAPYAPYYCASELSKSASERWIRCRNASSNGTPSPKSRSRLAIAGPPASSSSRFAATALAA